MARVSQSYTPSMSFNKLKPDLLFQVLNGFCHRRLAENEFFRCASDMFVQPLPRGCHTMAHNLQSRGRRSPGTEALARQCHTMATCESSSPASPLVAVGARDERAEVASYSDLGPSGEWYSARLVSPLPPSPPGRWVRRRPRRTPGVQGWCRAPVG